VPYLRDSRQPKGTWTNANPKKTAGLEGYPIKQPDFRQMTRREVCGDASFALAERLNGQI
jgi:hypothetical protein